MKGIFITEELLELEDLNLTEKVVLSIYKYYTEEGKYKCCSMTNSQICEILKMSERNLQMIKKHLKDLGYISCSGITVKYIGIGGETDFAPGAKNTSPRDEKYFGGDEEYFTPGVKNTSSRGEVDFTHNKEKKEKKNIIKKNKEENLTNFELVVDRLPVEYKKKEMIDYIVKEFGDRIEILNNNIDPEDKNSAVDCWVSQIKSFINTQFFVYPKQERVVEIKEDYIDLF